MVGLVTVSTWELPLRLTVPPRYGLNGGVSPP